MKTTTFAAAALFAASSASAATSTCPGINILEACLETTQGYLSLCTNQGDWQCLCDKWTAIVSCFDNCPTDSRASSFGNNKQLYCLNASLYATTTSVAVPTGTQSSGSNAAQTTSASGVQQTSASASTSSTVPSPTGAPGAAANLAVSAGGILAAVAAVVAAVL
ncbi:uncharacterized protein B0I36DRAFT_113605 [Microdochium trichocladiopsis]|uniref:GPI anchored serine-threonine rich protein n=1 Tax=Microdochium trichocladiopsis TaxID=1682393 RepID=A0A9P9BTS4_9PEZI|nr:uncharacterized protein B0I36DRAFT_113605 [Microdochium trichocladiopsis]KAH7030754.1 hypothetical protein B0I36DRAFT_113605 [Microdochium trichocladiopsis]